MWMEEVVAHLFSLIFHSFHHSEADYQVPEQFSFYGVRFLISSPNPQPGGPGYPSSSGSYPLTCPAYMPFKYTKEYKLYARPRFTPKENVWFSFLLEAESISGP
jgi:hypothetical protein